MIDTTPTVTLPTVKLPGGETVPGFGLGTWHMGEDRRRASEEAAAVRLGIELGMTLIDTAEMYGSGGAEEVVGRGAHGGNSRIADHEERVVQHVDADVEQRPAAGEL